MCVHVGLSNGAYICADWLDPCEFCSSFFDPISVAAAAVCEAVWECLENEWMIEWAREWASDLMTVTYLQQHVDLTILCTKHYKYTKIHEYVQKPGLISQFNYENIIH